MFIAIQDYNIKLINMKYIYTKLFFVAVLTISLSSCVNDDDTFGANENKPKATTSVSSMTLAEGESDVIPFAISNPISKASQFKIELVGGNGNQDDILAGDQDTDADTGVPHEGFEITVPAYATSFDIPVESLLDLDCEGTETIKLKITAAGVRTIVTPSSDGYIINLTIENTPVWVLEGVDTYGDGWNGASIDATIDGVTTSYTVDADLSTFYIPVPEGADYSFAFASGDWDGEIEYTLTAPDGTVYADAYYPAVGEITSGTQPAPVCN